MPIAAALAGLFGLWSLQTSIRIAYEAARWLNGGSYPVLAHVLITFLLLAIVTGAWIIRADALGLPVPWFMVAVTFGGAAAHFAALVGAEKLGAARRRRSDAAA